MTSIVIIIVRLLKSTQEIQIFREAVKKIWLFATSSTTKEDHRMNNDHHSCFFSAVNLYLKCADILHDCDSDNPASDAEQLIAGHFSKQLDKHLRKTFFSSFEDFLQEIKVCHYIVSNASIVLGRIDNFSLTRRL